MKIENLNVSYGKTGLRSIWNKILGFGGRKPDESIHGLKGRTHAVKNVNLPIYENEILALIGPSGCGKSTVLRCLNRMNDTIDGCVVTGKITMNGVEIDSYILDAKTLEAKREDGQTTADNVDISDKAVELEKLRQKIGMVFQKPNPFPKSIRENVAYPARMAGVASAKDQVDEVVEKSLKQASLYDEVKDDFNKRSGTELSGGQQQRLCIARALSHKPQILLMDEPCASLDPVSTAAIEKTIKELAKDYTIVIITHNMEQAARISHRVAHFHMGEIVAYGPTREMFTEKDEKKVPKITQQYVKGDFG